VTPMPTLHLGVNDIPYNEPPPSGKRRRKKIAAGTQTTGDVAEILEAKYHIFENFWELHKENIAGDLEDGLAGALESLLMGAPTSLDVFGSATSKIGDRFKKFLSEGEMEKIGYPGVPTQAALDRRSGKKRSARFKRARPGTGVSFIDSGLYSASSLAWIT